MVRARLASFWVGLALAFVVALPSLAAPKFPPLTGRVVDDAQILSPEAESRLTAELAALEQKTGHQVVVATLPSLQGYEIEDYGYQLLRTWGIGRKAEDDGVILIVAPSERKVRIEVGYGLEPVLTDALSSLIIQRKILPAFKAGKMEQGVVDGAEAIVAQLGLPPEEAQQRAAEALTVARPSDSGAIDLNGAIVTGIFVIMGIVWILRAFGRRRSLASYRRDPNGWAWVLPLIISELGRSGRGGGGWRGGGGGWSGGGGGFSGGGGSGGGGGASGSW
jgi:uncharacterized protein